MHLGPSSVPVPMGFGRDGDEYRLTPEQLEEFKTNGYLHLKVLPGAALPEPHSAQDALSPLVAQQLVPDSWSWMADHPCSWPPVLPCPSPRALRRAFCRRQRWRSWRRSTSAS